MKQMNVLRFMSRAGFVTSVCVLMLTACGDDGGKNGPACGANEVYASVENITDCYAKCTSGVCAVGFICEATNQICIPSSTFNQSTSSDATTSTNDDPNNSSNHNTSTNNTSGSTDASGSNNESMNTNNDTSNTNNTHTNTNGTTNPDPQLVTLCEQACDLLYGSCITDNCTLSASDESVLAGIKADCVNGLDGGPTCAEDAANDPAYRSALQSLVTNTCEDIKSLRCGDFGLTEECGCATPTNLGAACTASSQCDGGDIAASCIPEVNVDGDPTGYVGGYCAAVPCPVLGGVPPYSYRSPVCGDGGVCTVAGTEGSEQAFCRAGCGPSCRSNGYACQVLDLELSANNALLFVTACLPKCTADADCGAGSRCDMASGSCQIPCTTTPLGGTVGNPSLADACANSGGSCSAGAPSFCVIM